MECKIHLTADNLMTVKFYVVLHHVSGFQARTQQGTGGGAGAEVKGEGPGR